MKIHKALKLKNRLVGSIASKREIVRRENSRRSDSASTVDVEATLIALNEDVVKLVNLKTAIAVATAPISGLLVRLAETKDEINFWRGLPTRKGVEIQSIGRDLTKEYTWTAYADQETVDKALATLQERIATLQDQVDEFNAATEVLFAG